MPRKALLRRSILGGLIFYNKRVADRPWPGSIADSVATFSTATFSRQFIR